MSLMSGFRIYVTVNDEDSPKTILGDNPIRRTEDDALERTDLAAAFARQVSNLDATDGAVIGVFGPWG